MRRAVLVMVTVVVLGCRGQPPAPSSLPWVPEPAPDLGDVVARVGDVSIFAAEVRAQAERTGKSPRLAFEELVAFHLLAEKARERGERPDEVAVPRALLVQRFLEREFEAVTRESDLTDQELRGLYEKRRDVFMHPRLVEVVVLAVYTGALMKPEPRAHARKVAEELARTVASRPLRTPEDFFTIAAEPSWRERRVTVTRLLQGPDKPFGPALGAAAVRLARPGDTTPLVEDETGLYIARYIAEKPPESVPFEAVREQIRREVYPYWRQRRFGELVARLARGHAVEVYPGKLAQPLAQTP